MNRCLLPSALLSAKLGGCLSALAAGSGKARRQKQEAQWTRTGIVSSLRDAGLKVVTVARSQIRARVHWRRCLTCLRPSPQAGSWTAVACVLQELPASLDDAAVFSAVRTIDFTSNKLTQLPGFLGNFGVLQRLVLSRNLLAQLPGELCYLTSLKAKH